MKKLFENWKKFLNEEGESEVLSDISNSIDDLADAEEEEDETIADLKKKQEEEDEMKEKEAKEKKNNDRNTTQDTMQLNQG